MLRAVNFDMDGLMVDTEYLHHKSFSAVLKKHEITPKPNKQGVIHISGVSAEANWERFMREHSFSADIHKLTDMKNKAQESLLQQEVRAMPGLGELIKDLKKRHIKIAIASSSVRNHINLITDSLRLTEYFDAIVSGEDIEQGKPAPDIYLRAAGELGVSPGECCALEDAMNGVRAAKSAGMKVVAVPNNFTQHENFDQADALVPTLLAVNAKLLSKLSQPPVLS